MKRIFTILLLSMFMAIGTGETFADRHDGHGRDRKEQHYKGRPGGKDRNHGKDHHDKKYKENKKHDKHKDYRHDKRGDYRHDKRHARPAPRHYAPAPPRRHHTGRYAPPPPPPPPRLGHMVRYATRGMQDVAVWQVSHDTYIVKYRHGNRYYTRYLYPYAERYGNPSVISVGWQPLSPWTLIPPIQLNINL